MQVPGIQFVTDEKGRRLGVLPDLRKHAEIWEDIYDALIALKRKSEPRESLASVRRRLHKPAKLGE